MKTGFMPGAWRSGRQIVTSWADLQPFAFVCAGRVCAVFPSPALRRDGSIGVYVRWSPDPPDRLSPADFKVIEQGKRDAARRFKEALAAMQAEQVSAADGEIKGLGA